MALSRHDLWIIVTDAENACHGGRIDDKSISIGKMPVTAFDGNEMHVVTIAIAAVGFHCL
jgi:hypothetical protein